MNFKKLLAIVLTLSFLTSFAIPYVSASEKPLLTKTARWTDYDNGFAEITLEAKGKLEKTADIGSDNIIIMDYSGSMSTKLTPFIYVPCNSTEIVEDKSGGLYTHRCEKCGAGYNLVDWTGKCDEIRAATNRWELSKLALEVTLEDIIPDTSSKSEVAFIAFEGNDIISDTYKSGFTNDKNQILSKADSLRDPAILNGGTNYRAALKTALTYINQKLSDGIERPINIIFMSDGQPHYTAEGKTEIEEIKQKASVYTIGLALKDSESEFLKGYATDSTYHYNVTDPNDLIDAFDKVGDCVASMVNIKDIVTSDYYEVIEVSSPTSGKADYDNIKTITWTLDDLKPEGDTLKIKIKLKDEFLTKDGDYKTNEKVNAYYIENGITTNLPVIENEVSSETPNLSRKTTKYYEVSFDTQGGNLVPSEQVENGQNAVEPTEPSRNGWIFTGWYTDKGCTTKYLFNTPVTSDITLYAGWSVDAYITAKDITVIYDGKNHGIEVFGVPSDCEIVYNDPVYNNYKDVGVYPVDFTIIKNGEYKISQDTATLTIVKRPITIRASNASKTYDGTPLNAHDYEIVSGSLADGQKAVVTLSGSQTEVGASASKIDSVTIKDVDKNVTSNYEITVEYGILDVKEVPQTTKNGGSSGGSSSGGNSGGSSGGSSGGGKSSKTVDIPNTEVPLTEMQKLNKDEHFNYILGYPEGDVRPYNNITREEVALIFYRLLNDNYRDMIFTHDENFRDISSERWSISAIATLANGEIFMGYEDGTFKAEKFITRAEFAAVASRFDALEETNTNSFSDIEGNWAKKYINSAAKKGWIKGYEDGTFKPNQNISRAEAITLINRVLERRVDSDGLIDGFKIFSDNKPDAWYYYDIIEASNYHEFAERENGSDFEKWSKILTPKTWR